MAFAQSFGVANAFGASMMRYSESLSVASAADSSSAGGFHLLPLVYAPIRDRVRPCSSSHKLRPQLPLKLVATIERVLADNRYVISLADDIVSLEQMQCDFGAHFSRLDAMGAIVSVDKVKPGDYCLYKDRGENVFRVRILDSMDGSASACLVDFGRFTIVDLKNLYMITDDFCDDYPHPFVARVVLPPDEVLRSFNLPTNAMFQSGDIVDVIVLSAQEPHLAVFGFARSISRRILPTSFVDGFQAEEAKNWASLFTDAVFQSEPVVLQRGFGRLSNRDRHTNRLALSLFAKSLDKVYVRDLDSAIRLAFLRERLGSIYSTASEHFTIKQLSGLNVGKGCVAYHAARDAYMRVEIVSLGKDQVEVVPVDEPSLGLFTVNKTGLFAVPSALDFPCQHFSVRMARHSEGQRRYYLSRMARNVIPDGTPIIVDTDLEFGLTKVMSANAPKSLLSTVGFHDLGEQKQQPHSLVVDSIGFEKTEPITMLDDINKFAKSIEPKKKSALKKKK
jgi:hypothetical protein